MDMFEKLEKLAERARGDVVPPVHVDMDVVLRDRPAVAGMIFPMAWAAGISAVAAGLLLIVTLHVTTTTTGTTVATSGNNNVTDALFSATKVEMP